MENNASNKTFKAYLVTNLYPYDEMYEVKQKPDYCGDSVEEVKDKIIDDIMNSRHGDWGIYDYFEEYINERMVCAHEHRSGENIVFVIRGYNY
jgi:hypothetical protein|nr:MAG TPA: hypothetical protein [Caudoviricetes sp.]